MKPRAQSNREAIEQRLLATSFPRLHMLLMLTLAALGSFLSSAALVSFGLSNMALRYGLAVVAGYSFFLVFVRLWISYQTERWSIERLDLPRARDVARLDAPDLSGLANALDGAGGGLQSSFSGAGGTFGGGGASGTWGDGVSESGTSGVLEAVADTDDAWVIVIAAVAVLGGLVALGFVVYSSPALLAEVLLDVAVVGAAYKKNRGHERAHWATGVLRRTYKPALLLAVVVVIFGFIVQSTAPEATTLGAVLRAHRAESNQ